MDFLFASPGSCRRGDPHPAPGKQDGHGRVPPGVRQRGGKTGPGELASNARGCPRATPDVLLHAPPPPGKPGDVLRGQRLHEQERDGVPDTPGQVRRSGRGQRGGGGGGALTGCCVFVQSVNGAGGQGEGHNRGPQRPAHQEETLLQVNVHVGWTLGSFLDSKHTAKLSFWTGNRS